MYHTTIFLQTLDYTIEINGYVMYKLREYKKDDLSMILRIDHSNYPVELKGLSCGRQILVAGFPWK